MKIKFLPSNFVKVRVFRDQISTKPHAAISFKKLFEGVLLRFILKLVRVYTSSTSFLSHKSVKILLDILHTENTYFDRIVCRAKKVTALPFLFRHFDMFYAKNEATDIFFVMKPKTGRTSLFNAAFRPFGISYKCHFELWNFLIYVISTFGL